MRGRGSHGASWNTQRTPKSPNASYLEDQSSQKLETQIDTSDSALRSMPVGPVRGKIHCAIGMGLPVIMESIESPQG